MITQVTFKNVAGNTAKLRDNRLTSWNFNLDRTNDTTLTITITHKSAGRISQKVPIVHLLELMGGKIDTIEKPTKSEKKIKKKEKKHSQAPAPMLTPALTLAPTQPRMVPLWDGPHNGFCKVNVKVNGKLPMFSTLPEAQAEAIRLGPQEVGGITMYNNTYRLRKAKHVTCNPQSTKKGEKSWLFKIVPETPIETIISEENTKTIPSNTEQETTSQSINDNNETTNIEELPALAEDESVTLTSRMKQYNNMMKILENFSNFDAEGFEYSDWKYKKNDFKVLVHFNIIIYKNEIVGMRFYDKEQDGYYPIFINEDDF